MLVLTCNHDWLRQTKMKDGKNLQLGQWVRIQLAIQCTSNQQARETTFLDCRQWVDWGTNFDGAQKQRQDGNSNTQSGSPQCYFNHERSGFKNIGTIPATQLYQDLKETLDITTRPLNDGIAWFFGTNPRKPGDVCPTLHLLSTKSRKGWIIRVDLNSSTHLICLRISFEKTKYSS